MNIVLIKMDIKNQISVIDQTFPRKWGKSFIPFSIYFFTVAFKYSKLSICFALIGYIPSVVHLFIL